MRRSLTAQSRSVHVIRCSLLCVLAAVILLGIPSLAVADPITIDVTNDAAAPCLRRSPILRWRVLGSGTSPVVRAGAYPVLGGHTSNKSLSVVHAFAPVPNGRYLVFANVYGQPGPMVLGTTTAYPASGNPTAFGVDVGPQVDCAEVVWRRSPWTTASSTCTSRVPM